MTKQTNHENGSSGPSGETGQHSARSAQVAAEFEEHDHADEAVVAEASASAGAEAGGGSVEASDAKRTAAQFDMPLGETDAAAAEPALEQLIAQLQGDVEAGNARYAELLDKFQRSAAEFQNSRRRQEKQTSEAIERASTQIVRKLLPVLDDFDLAFASVPATISDEQAAWVDGFRQIQRKLLTLIEEEGVRPIPSDGAFDPAQHEAVSSEPNASVESGNIIATLRVGYEQRGHVLRPSLVRVSA